MYLNQTDADADDTGSAVWTIDNITLSTITATTTVVDNVTDLAAVDVVEFQSAYIEGTTTIADGGQGRFYYDSTSTATENGTTVVTPDSVGGGAGRWIALAKVPVNRRVVTADETYTPPVNVSMVTFEAIGGGGGSGGTQTTSSQYSAAGGGGGGGWASVTSETIGTSYAIVIGTGGLAGAVAATGGTGASTTVIATPSGVNLAALGGEGGKSGTAGATSTAAGGTGGLATGFDKYIKGNDGSIASSSSSATINAANQTGSSHVAIGMAGVLIPTASLAGVGYGVGAGAVEQDSARSDTQVGGAAGADGAVIITEYL
jgi:hypothetical protein